MCLQIRVIFIDSGLAITRSKDLFQAITGASARSRVKVDWIQIELPTLVQSIQLSSCQDFLLGVFDKTLFIYPLLDLVKGSTSCRSVSIGSTIVDFKPNPSHLPDSVALLGKDGFIRICKFDGQVQKLDVTAATCSKVDLSSELE